MANRSGEDILRILRPRDDVEYLDGDDSEEEILDAVEDHDSDASEASVSDFETENDDDDEEVESEPEQSDKERRRRKYAYGKNKYKWCLQAPEVRGRRSAVREILPEAKHMAVTARTPLDYWSALFTNDILEHIVKYTNEEIVRFEPDTLDADRVSYYRATTMIEMKAFVGLLYYLGANRNNKVTTGELWSRQFGTMLCKVTMSQHRFKFLSSKIRFDDKSTRAERRQEDGLAPVREIWDIFIKNCELNYSPGQFVTIDEQLLGFRGRFSSRVYIKSKPARYGIKIVSINDAKTYYMFNALPYVGKVPANRGESVPSYYVRKLSEPIYNTSRNITCDNWFSSVEIFNSMRIDHGLTMVGTVRKNKRQLPESFRKNASPGTTRYGYDGHNVLVSFCPKRNKVVLLLSSMHKTGKKDEDCDKPEIRTFYNKTKCGTDVFDQLCGNYSCARRSNRWTMRFFLGMLDQASVNASILYNMNVENESRNRIAFLKDRWRW
ncbi:PREDICTED: piggyBac transposable element-derived protein 4-like [Cyphomyrmex costatus]|uniref:piggyBac transposable element-derived protein 4-like n=1 Tax=Cyphomyrmex costatus TaxID=456900 RepID=UPI000852239D|nr:PREDICTED: piggyBac transposable element-derived protein 4-like [Cyphomyrmex costatus]